MGSSKHLKRKPPDDPEYQKMRPEGFPTGRIVFGDILPCTPCDTKGWKVESSKRRPCRYCDGVGYTTRRDLP